VALAFTIVTCVVRFWLLRLRGPRTLERRAIWVQDCARRFLKCLDITSTIEGDPAAEGLVVANHLSYLDIVVISSAMPCFFVAKMEIGGWPFFGRAARSGGTIFVNRGSRESALSVAEQIKERLRSPTRVPVLLFPEGTSTDGSEVKRFHSRLIDPATSLGVPITAAAIRYKIHDGTPERELCWYGDENFLNHLWKVLGVGGFEAEVLFGAPRIYSDRRAAADATHEEIAAMREQSAREKQLLASSL
jgi:1-acyl-sn-glycerol-3-phosphate acyltransferase